MWHITLIDLLKLNHISRMNPTWSWCMILFMYFWIWFVNILLSFASFFIKVLTRHFLSFSVSLVLVQDDGSFTEWIWDCFLLSVVFWNRLRNIGINFSLYVWQNSSVKPSSLRLLFAQFCFIIIKNCISLMICSSYLFLIDSVSADFMLLETCLGEGNGHPLQRSCLENPRDGGAWWAVVSGVTQSRTRLKWLSSSSKNLPISSRFSNLLTGNCS